MAKVCRVDAFYVGFFRGDKTIAFPYNFDGQEYDIPEQLNYSEQGMCAWILKHKRPYFYPQDNGVLLRNGQNFGDVSRISADAIVIPLFESSSTEMRVVGMASVQSYEANSYNRESAQAFQWLAKSVMTVLLRNREDTINRHELGVDDRFDFQDPISAIVEEISFKIESLRKEAQEVRRTAREVNVESLEAALDRFCASCERIQTDTMELLMAPTVPDSDPFNQLTKRQKEVAKLIARDYTNEQIAASLKIAPETVKTHVSKIIGKFGVRQRDGVAAKLGRHIT